jgi:hypothetical protein
MVRHPAAGSWGRLPAAVRLLFGVVLAAAFFGVFAPAPARAAEPVVKIVENQAGRRDTLALYDLGNHTAGLYTFVSTGGRLGRVLSWQSAKGGFDVAHAKFAAGDVNGDGLADGIALYDLGHGTSCLYVFISNGDGFVKKRAWKSTVGGFSWSRAKLAVGDINADGRDDVIVLYDRGKGRASLYRFISKGTTFARSLAYTSTRGGLYSSRSQLVAGDATGDGRADAIVLYRGSPARLWVFAAKGAKFAKKAFWSGTYPASAKLAVGDVDSDGDVDAVCLRSNLDGRVALDVFLSGKTAFAAPAPWWLSAAGSMTFAASRVACGDVTGDGKTDAMIITSTGTTTALAATCASTGAAFESGAWWTGAMQAGKTRLACAPGAPLILTDAAEVLTDAAVDALKTVSPDGVTFTFTGGNPQIDGLAAGDVIVTEPSAELPYGALRKVTAVGGSAGDTVVTTEQAALEEVIKEGELSVGGTLTQNDIIRTMEPTPGMRLVPFRDAQDRAHGLARRIDPRLGITIEIDTTILEAVNINGNLSFNQSFGLSSHFGYTGMSDTFIPYPTFGIKSVRFTSTSTQTTALRASLQKSFKAEKKVEWPAYRFPTFVVVFGVVPVTFTPELTFYVGASGDVTAGVTARVTQVTTVTGGLEWTNSGGWKPIKESSASRTFDPPQPFGKMELKAFAGLELMLKIYEVAGPTAALEAYLKLAASTLETPWWKLSCGVDAKAGVKVEALGKTIFETSATFNIFDVLLDEAPGKYEPQGAVSGDVLVTSTTTGVDGATVELRAGAASPSGTLKQTTTSGDDGWYTFTAVPAGDYTVVASRSGFTSNNRTVSVTGGEATGGQDIEISSLAVPGVSGTVTDGQAAAALSGATVELRLGTDNVTGPVLQSSTTPAGGTYLYTNLIPSTYTVAASKTGFFSARVTVTVGPLLVPGQDLELWPLSSQGVGGRVYSVVDDSDVAGATVTLHEGYLKPDGPVWGTTTSAADGTYTFDGVPADQYEWGQSDYTVVATKPGFVRGVADTDVNRGEKATGVDLGLAPTDGSSPAKATRADDFILWPEASLWNDEDTYELWFKPGSTTPGFIAQTSFGYGNFPGGTWGNAPVMWIILDHMSRIQFGINEEDGGGPGDGTQHVLVGMSFLQVGQWYHIAAECGPAGMKLFVNGSLDASDPYTGRPEADWSDGTLNSGGFSLGDNDSWWPSYATASGQYKWVRVSSVQRYWADFTPPPTLAIDGATDVLDPLLGDTNGWNRGMVWTP